MKVVEKVNQVKETLQDYPNVTLVGAAKYLGVEQTKELIDAGVTHIGENRSDMFLEKYQALKDYEDVKWHFIGTLQSRKIKDVANRIDYLHSLDSLSIARGLNSRLKEPLKCFVQVNITQEDNKGGVPINKVTSFVKSLEQFPKIQVVGLMCIAQLTFDNSIIEKQFSQMKQLQEEVQALNLEHAPCTELSMGMSNDYKLALEYGATYVRIGRKFL